MLLVIADILMFRGTDFISDAIARVSQGHGADHFSHVGMVIKAPLVPRHGRYMKSGAIDTTGEFGSVFNGRILISYSRTLISF